jgi:hypothetical protein
VSKKDAKIESLIASCNRPDLNPHFEGYFVCFNQRLYFEAHDVLEHLWLKDKSSPEYAFYKGLIQLAGAFVHLQKGRLKPSLALFNLAKANLLKYPAIHHQLNVGAVLRLIASWSAVLIDFEFQINPLTFREPPILLPSALSRSLSDQL